MKAIFFPDKRLVHIKRDQMVFCVICQDLCVRGSRCDCCRAPRVLDAPGGTIPLAA